VKKRLIFIAVLSGVIYFLAWHLQPFDPHFFSFHDDTQVGRMKEFVFALQNIQIPPRMAPHFSSGMGFPVFNFYAPFSYWIGSILNMFGIPIVAAAKTTLFLAVVVSFVSMFLFASTLFSFDVALVVGTLYTSSAWLATEIFARGNFGEMWFIALFPLALYFLEKNSHSRSRIIFVATAFIICFTLTTHNVLTIVGAPLLVLYVFILRKSISWNLIAIGIGILLGAYFFLPLTFENQLTYAKSQAEATKYIDHFLCIRQVWDSPTWELGGSGKGCNDGMSFKVGKLQLMFSLLGILSLIFGFFKKRKQIIKPIYFLVIGLSSLYMMLDISTPIWKFFSFVLAPFQFPWRFNTFFLFSVSILGGYAFYFLKKMLPNRLHLTLIAITILTLFVSAMPYFRHPWRITYNEYYDRYVGDWYIYKDVAYGIPEYLPRTASFVKWMEYGKNKIIKRNPETYISFIATPNELKVDDSNVYKKSAMSIKKQIVTINLHYFPYWTVKINDKRIVPSKFDELGRPMILLEAGDRLSVSFAQTPIEQVGNVVSLIAILICLLVILYPNIWKKLNHINN